MKYKGKKITEPTLAMFKEHIARHHLAADPEYVYEYYKRKGWRTRSGKKVSSIESMVGGLNWRFTNGKTPPPIGQEAVAKEQRPSYDQQLEDKKWKAFREFIFIVRGKKCEKCGATTWLQIHHPKYRGGRLAWEYTCNEVIVLCRDCHRKEHGLPVDSMSS